MNATLEPVLRVAELRALERSAKAEGLMERAGAAAADVARALAGERGGTVVVLAGPGNNGGDGLVVARLLRAAYFDVVVVFRDDANKLPDDAAAAWRAYTAAGGATQEGPPDRQPALVIDALFGVGISPTRALARRHAQLVEWANACTAPTLALDVPTGLNADTGIAAAPTIRASATATFLALKPGMLTAAGPDLCGEISLHRLDVAVDDDKTDGHCLRWPALAACLPQILHRHARNVHKGTFGTLAVIGGADGMLGAPLLCAHAALRLGAGKVIVGFVADDHPQVDTATPELMLRSAEQAFDGASALVIGPGLGTAPVAHGLLERALATDLPLLLDADALNLVAGDATLRTTLQSRASAQILTPHPGEAARLRATDIAAIQRDRCAAAMALARSLHAQVVVKGAGSVLAYVDGTWDINASGNSALAVAGSGDVLSGMAGALLAQRIDAKMALRTAVCLHGAAADALVARAIGPLGLPASSIADEARDLVNRACAITARSAG